MIKKLSLLLCGSAVLTGVAFGQKDAGTVIDPTKVGPEYAVQGEYVGVVDGEKTGVQVIALGKGAFEAVVYPGGLPGDGWNGEEKMKFPGKTEGEMTVFKGEGGERGELKDGVISAFSKDGEKLGELKRVVRESPTLGATAPKSAKVLFDGTSVEGWKGGKMTEDGLLEQGTTTEEKFGDFTLHIEFMLPFKPDARGQGRGNSGVYMQGRYEVQVLDSFGLEGKNNEAGGIYSVKDPDVNMCFPPLTWQTYDIDFTAAKFEDGKKVENARMTVRHNGVVVHDNVEVPKSTTAAPVKEGAEPGPLYLQNHGNPVRFRNIWMVLKDD